MKASTTNFIRDKFSEIREHLRKASEVVIEIRNHEYKDPDPDLPRVVGNGNCDYDFTIVGILDGSIKDTINWITRPSKDTNTSVKRKTSSSLHTE